MPFLYVYMYAMYARMCVVYLLYVRMKCMYVCGYACVYVCDACNVCHL